MEDKHGGDVDCVDTESAPQSWTSTPHRMRVEPIPARLNELARTSVDVIYKVHRTLGPGLLESIYEICLVHDLKKCGLTVERQIVLPVHYDGVRLDSGLRLDLLVHQSLILELKSVEVLLPVHTAQMLTYLKLTGCRLGLLVNFNVPLIREGIKRIAL